MEFDYLTIRVEIINFFRHILSIIEILLIFYHKNHLYYNL
jgi:hypothetical protein